jgi:hypothetical protein
LLYVGLNLALVYRWGGIFMSEQNNTLEANVHFFWVPGFPDLRIPRVTVISAPENSIVSGILTRAYRVSFHFSSSKVYTELFGYIFGVDRTVVADVYTNFFPNASFRLEPLYIVIKMSKLIPILEKLMNDGTVINLMTIRRYGWMLGKQVTIEDHQFRVCYITFLVHMLDYAVFRIVYRTVDSTVHAFDQNGKPTGQTSTSIDTITGKLATKS